MTKRDKRVKNGFKKMTYSMDGPYLLSKHALRKQTHYVGYVDKLNFAYALSCRKFIAGKMNCKSDMLI